ncbi:unnamed protein product [Effrenium voratum]|nr:unnamed protein product [Effrenium voratum]
MQAEELRSGELRDVLMSMKVRWAALAQLTFEHLCGAWAHVAGTAMPLVLWHQCCADGWQVWDAAADCAETLPSVELHTPLNARERVCWL